MVIPNFRYNQLWYSATIITTFGRLFLWFRFERNPFMVA
jgi:hypothetical protein